MRKIVIIISLFFLGTIFSLKAQEMTPKEKYSYAIGIMLGEKIKSSGIDTSIIDSIKVKIDFESIREGIRDNLKGECKLTKEEMQVELAEFQKRMDYYDKSSKAKQNKGEENEEEKSLLEKNNNKNEVK